MQVTFKSLESVPFRAGARSNLVADSDQLFLPVDIFPPQDLVLGVFSDQFTAPEAGKTRHSKKRDQFRHLFFCRR